MSRNSGRPGSDGIPVKVVRVGRRAPRLVVSRSDTLPVPLANVRAALGMVDGETSSDDYLEHLIDVAESRVEDELGRAIRPQLCRWFCYGETPHYVFALPEPPRGLSTGGADVVDNAVRVYNLRDDGTELAISTSVYTVRGLYVTVRQGQQWPAPIHAYEEIWAMDVECGFETVPADVQFRITQHARHLFDPERYSEPAMQWRSRWYFTRPSAASWGGWSF